jgi:hypothetical protein
MGEGSGRETERAVRSLAHAARDFRHPGGKICRIAEAVYEPAHIRSRYEIPRVGGPLVRAAIAGHFVIGPLCACWPTMVPWQGEIELAAWTKAISHRPADQTRDLFPMGG